jgi:hypothetical protein
MEERKQDPPPVDPGSYPEYGIVVRIVVVRMVVGTMVGMVVGVSVPTPARLLDNPDTIHYIYPFILIQEGKIHQDTISSGDNRSRLFYCTGHRQCIY